MPLPSQGTSDVVAPPSDVDETGSPVAVAAPTKATAPHIANARRRRIVIAARLAADDDRDLDDRARQNVAGGEAERGWIRRRRRQRDRLLGQGRVRGTDERHLETLAAAGG